MIVDAHHHLWDVPSHAGTALPGQFDYSWMDGAWADPIRGRFDGMRLAPLLARHGVDVTIAVQAVVSVEETRWLLETSPPFVGGVVGWVNLTGPGTAATLASLKAGPGSLLGVRAMAQNEPDTSWLQRVEVRQGLTAVADAGLACDLLIKPPQYAAALATARALPSLQIIIDHAAKPDIAGGMWEPWAAFMARLAALPNVTVKLSGLAAEPRSKPYVRHVLDLFGPERAMFGSDWPVCTLTSAYGDVFALVAGELTDGERAAVLGKTAARTYRIGN